MLRGTHLCYLRVYTLFPCCPGNCVQVCPHKKKEGEKKQYRDFIKLKTVSIQHLPPPSLHCVESSPHVSSEPESVGHIFVIQDTMCHSQYAYTQTGPWMCLEQEGTHCFYKCLRGNDTQGNFLGLCKPGLLSPDHTNIPEWVLYSLLHTVKIVGHLLLCKIALCLRFCTFFT